MSHSPFSFRRIVLDQGSVELTEEYIRLRAYQLYEQRGRQDGHDMEDWLQAEAEVFGRKSSASAEKMEKQSEGSHADAAA
jgi:Protein of unknown function (DUF2934)